MTARTSATKTLGWKLLLAAPTVLGLLAGFLLAYVLPTRYISSSLIWVPRVAGDLWGEPDAPESEWVVRTPQRAWAFDRLRALLDDGGTMDAARAQKRYREIRASVEVRRASDNRATGSQNAVGFDLIYTHSTAQRAQKVCQILTTSLVQQPQAERQSTEEQTTQFLMHVIEDAKKDVEKTHAQSLKRPSDRKLALEYKRARESYEDLVSKMNGFEIGAGPVLRVIRTCGTPLKPSFPNRPLCVAVGSGAGLLLGIVAIATTRKSDRKTAEPSKHHMG